MHVVKKFLRASELDFHLPDQLGIFYVYWVVPICPYVEDVDGEEGCCGFCVDLFVDL